MAGNVLVIDRALRPGRPGSRSKAIAFAGMEAGGFRAVEDPSRPGPQTAEDAVEEFVAFVCEAVRHNCIPDHVRFSGLVEWYEQTAIYFGWPRISDVRLTRLLQSSGCTKVKNRDRTGGGDIKWISYRMPAFGTVRRDARAVA